MRDHVHEHWIRERALNRVEIGLWASPIGEIHVGYLINTLSSRNSSHLKASASTLTLCFQYFVRTIMFLHPYVQWYQGGTGICQSAMASFSLFSSLALSPFTFAHPPNSALSLPYAPGGHFISTLLFRRRCQPAYEASYHLRQQCRCPP